MANDTDKRLRPADVEMVLRRASELNARRKTPDSTEDSSVSPEVLVQVAAAAGIPEADVRRALLDLDSEKSADPDTLARKLYGDSRLRNVREVERPMEPTREHLEVLLRKEQGLKLRRKTEAGSLYDAGDLLGVVRRALDFSGHRSLLKAQSIELRMEEIDEDRCGVNLTADVSNQRNEYLSLGGILGATVALPVAIAGFTEPLYFLLVPPALAASGFGFKLAYRKTCAEIRRALDELLDVVEEGPPGDEPPDRGDMAPGEIRGLAPIPKFSTQNPRQD